MDYNIIDILKKCNNFDFNVINLNISKHLDGIVKNMIKTLTKMPYLHNIPQILPVYNSIRIICVSCIGVVICYKGLKTLFSYDNNTRMQNKELMGRLGYAAVFGAFSIPMIDALIKFNNILIELLTSKFTMIPMMNIVGSSYGFLLSMSLLIIELLCSIKIMIDFWSRMAELVFMGTISPIIMLLWINGEWSNYLKTWFRRVVVLIFSQFAQVLLLILYSIIVSGLLLTGTLNGIFLSIAMLLFMIKVPKIMGEFFQPSSTIVDLKNSLKKIKSLKNGFSKFKGR